ncbi:Ribonuclease H domain - like 1 [Theobroma cacao]|nr:Ribonuclease H domain - like 1 [Theobroma cacao]
MDILFQSTCKREEVLIGWSPPFGDSIVLNSDGACRDSLAQATASGILRDSAGDRHGVTLFGWVAELCGAYTGLKLAWELGFPKIIAQVDSQLVARAITSTSYHPCRNSDLINAIQGLMGQQREVTIRHAH